MSNESKDIYTEKYLNKISKSLFGNADTNKLKDIIDQKSHKNAVLKDVKEGEEIKIQGTLSRVKKINLFLIPWLISTFATSGSLYFSEVMKFTPCTLCWYQ